MRRFHLATLIATLLLISAGCRQTTGPTTAGPLTPVGPSSTLSPVGTGQAPTLGPFGGSTRVTPPATGSYTAPNNYLGGTVPGGQASVPRPGVSVAGGVNHPNRAVGSGVEVAGWTETNSVISPSAQPPFPAQQQATVQPPQSQSPRGGGMRVIDMTGAPPPPGYRPSPQGFTNTFPGAAAPNQYPGAAVPGVQQNPNFQNSFRSPASQGMPPQNLVPQNLAPQNGGGGLRPVDLPQPGQIAGGQPSVAFPSGNSGSVPRTATAPLSPPSTQPVDPATGGSQDLPWRSPGTRY